jgi:ribosomal subunit interface protein
MKVTSIKGTNMDLTDAIKAYLDKKLESVEKLTSHFEPAAELSIEVGRTTTHHNKGDVHRAEMNLSVPGGLLRSECTASDLYEAIDLCKDDLVRQLKEYKEMHQERERGGQRPDKA